MRTLGKVFCVALIPGLGLAQEASRPAGPGLAQEASRPAGRDLAQPPEEAPPSASGEDEEQVRRFREAVAVLSSSNDAVEIAGSMKALQDGLPLSRPVLAEAARRGSPRTRAYAVRLLGERGEAEKDLEVVAGTLKDPVPSVRLAAVMAIQKLGEEGYPALKEHLPRERKPNIRKMAVKTLQRWGNPDAMPFLADLLRKEKHPGVRRFLVNALQELSGRQLGDDVSAWADYAQRYVESPQRKRIYEHYRDALEKRRPRENSEEP